MATGVFILIAILFISYISKLNVNEGKEIIFSNHLRERNISFHNCDSRRDNVGKINTVLL